jgi:hypothetical protein
MTEALDELLFSLASNFDDEELPLRRQEHLLQLIIEAAGDRSAAERQQTADEEAFVQQASFLSRLTATAMTPEQIGASPSAQRFAIALSRFWILAAHRSLLKGDNASIVQEIGIGIGEWHGQTQEGTNGSELAASLGLHHATKTQEALAAVRMGPLAWIGIGLPILVLLAWASGGCSLWMALLSCVGGGAAFLHARTMREKAHQKLVEQMAQIKSNALETLRGCLTEAAGYRVALRAALDEGRAVETLLEGLTPEVLIESPCLAASESDEAGEPGVGRRKDEDATEHGVGGQEPLATHFAGWDLLPPLVGSPSA